jgi:hypothetical protein
MAKAKENVIHSIRLMAMASFDTDKVRSLNELLNLPVEGNKEDNGSQIDNINASLETVLRNHADTTDIRLHLEPTSDVKAYVNMLKVSVLPMMIEKGIL